MANDSFTETTSTGWFSRIGNSIKGIVIGVVLIIGSAILMFWNEGRAVDTRKSLEEGQRDFVTISADALDSSKDGKLVYMTGTATASAPLSDTALNVTAGALRLRRSVEMYQWKEESKSETKKKLGGGEETTTTYSYVKDWSDKHIDSSKFKTQRGHENPAMPLESEEWTASPITVGAFSLSSGLAGQINNFTLVQADEESVAPETVGGRKVHTDENGFYLGKDPASPVIGDARVSHEAALPGDVSLISKLRGNSFEPFRAKAGGNIEMLETGNHSPESMFEGAHAGNKMMTWGLRVVGVLLMFFGFSAVFRPLSILADVLPIAGTIVGAGTSLVALLLTIPISLVIIAFSWIFYRPLIGIPLLVVAVVAIVFLIKKLMAQKKVQVAA